MIRLTAAILAVLALAGCGANSPAAPQPPKPDLYVLTSLPLLFDDGFALGPAKGAAAVYLRDHYRLQAIDLPSQLPVGATLLAAQPRALPAEELVALDAWVRAGGKMLLLADPMLEWPSKRPLGDRLRPPVAYPDTGLLAHWGLRLDAPDKRGLVPLVSPHATTEFLSPGRFVKMNGNGRLDLYGISAECALGNGKVLILADADWLNVEAIRALGGHPTDNMKVLGIFLQSLAPSK